MHKIDILAIGIHPDDVELSCGGTIAKHVALGYKVAILDLTQGEMGSRGTIESRKAESENAAKILNVAERITLNLPDVWLRINQDNLEKIITVIRSLRPKIVLINAAKDRHPNHPMGYEMAREACFYSGLSRLKTTYMGETQEHYRPKAVYSYIQSQFVEPDLVVDISDYYDIKINSIKAYQSQFHNPELDRMGEPSTFISDPDFLKLIEAKDKICGKAIGVSYAEGFVKERYIGVNDLMQLI